MPQVLLTEHDGKVDLELRNFISKWAAAIQLGVGNIKLSNLPATTEGDKKTFSGQGKATLTPGDLPGHYVLDGLGHEIGRHESRRLRHGRQPHFRPRLQNAPHASPHEGRSSVVGRRRVCAAC